jgi:hypothetical protein
MIHFVVLQACEDRQACLVLGFINRAFRFFYRGLVCLLAVIEIARGILVSLGSPSSFVALFAHVA